MATADSQKWALTIEPVLTRCLAFGPMVSWAPMPSGDRLVISLAFGPRQIVWRLR